MGGYDYNPAITERRSVEAKARLEKSGYQIMLRSAKLVLDLVIVRRGYLMANWVISLFVFLVFFAPAALAQQIYKWKDEKGRSHFSQTPPSGVDAEIIIEGSSTPKASPVNPPNQISNPPPPSGGGGKAEDISKAPVGRSSGSSREEATDKWLLLFPPTTKEGNDISMPFSEWTPWQTFDSADACNRNKGILIANSVRRRTEVVEEEGLIAWILRLRSSKTITEVDQGIVDSRCIHADELEPSKEANVFMVFEQSGYDKSGLTIPVLFGRVLNRGEATARNVVVKYQIRDNSGATISKGVIPTVPRDIPGITTAEFHGKIGGVGNLSGLKVNTEIDWSKD